MAFTVPETLASNDGRVMPGERKVFIALRDHLPEDYLVYYDIPVDGRYPDFIILGPDLGLVILEVKDWRLNRIAEITADEIRLHRLVSSARPSRIVDEVARAVQGQSDDLG